MSIDPTPLNSHFDRRSALAGLGALGAVAASAFAQPATASAARPKVSRELLTPEQLGWDAAKNEYALPPLPYAADALEPHLDAQTMTIHHGKHHASYVAGLNKALGELAKIRAAQGDASLVKHWSREVSFHGAGHINHSLFWLSLAPANKGGGGEPKGALADAIKRDFGGQEQFMAHYKAAAIQVEGSGWGWLALEPFTKHLLIVQVEKQQDLMPPGLIPLLGVDVWEHAYYLKFQNKRAEYVTAFMNVVNWLAIQARFEGAIG